MSEVKLSIIVPVYNVENQLEQCVDSLRAQTLKDIEIILVDDASKDKSPELCDFLARCDSRIKVIHKENEGAGKARNTGLKIAKGKYIGFVDSDDFVHEKMFETLFETSEKYDADLVMSGVIYTDGCVFKKDGEREEKAFFNEDTIISGDDDLKKLQLGIIGALPYEKEDSRYGMSVWKNLFKREIIEKNNLSFMSEREVMSEDSLFMIDYIGCIKRAVGIKEAFYFYKRNEASISKSYKKERFSESHIFIKEVEKRFAKNMEKNEYQLYLDRFIQSFSRVLCSQEIMYAKAENISDKNLNKRLKMICSYEELRRALKTYPIMKLPIKQAVFAYAMKYKLYFVQKLLVELRGR